ncbi:hypothetical protein CHUAL_002121 [Chamberlinius hualienensis]
MASNSRSYSDGKENTESETGEDKKMMAKLKSYFKCNGLPKLFERAADSWWDPKFDSDVLENQLIETSQPQVQRRFRYGLIYLLLIGITWAIYFGFTARQYWTELVSGCVAYSVFVLIIFLVTYAPFYSSVYFHLSLFLTSITCAISLAAFFTAGPPDPDQYDPEEGVGVAAGGDISTIGMFTIAVEVIAVVYTLVPLPLYVATVSLGVYSVAFEVLSALYTRDNSLWAIAVKSILHLVIHLIGIHIDIMNQVRMRSTFIKVCQKVLAKKELELERKLKENMIHSVMPPSVAEWLMKEGHWEDEDEDDDMIVDGSKADIVTVHRGSQDRGQIRSLFRPFHMNRMQEVSILFADICGFTRMSSNKTAERLVDLLNDLFGRFDALCEQLGCEKISTLGDCYYCVSGCPEPREDHARCCVEMGLAMISTIRQFDRDTGEDVNMRVGVHTGTILCGIVGTKRIKFDVWSNDVRLANTMESTGVAGRVHISAVTYSYVHNYYNVEEAEPYNDMKTYFILGHKDTSSPHSNFYQKLGIKPRIPIIDLPGTPMRMSDDEDTPSSSLRRSWSADCGVNGSRKDSGIRSQRSNSTQTTHILHMLDEELQPNSDCLCHRVSGYYTASQASIEEQSALQPLATPEEPAGLKRGGLHSFRRLRQKSDRQLIRGLREDEIHLDYFLHPPIKMFTLLFTDANVEQEYRRLVHRQDVSEVQPTLASPTFNTYFDQLVALVTYIVVALSCFVTFGAHIVWLLFCLGATSWQILVVVLCLKQFLNPRGSSRQLRNMYTWCTRWWPWHALGSLMLSGWIKSLVASVGVMAVLTMVESDVCKPHSDAGMHEMKENLPRSHVIFIANEGNTTEQIATSSPIQVSFTGTDTILHELILDILSILFLVWFLNREFEISYRMHFHGSLLAAKDWQKVQVLKEQADWLLHNIIPRHVAEHLKTDSKYSENHRRVGILFATIVNFNELYDESYRGGKECLRVLNELIADFDQLVSQTQFKRVDKIKTIGTTFMAASGLNRQLQLQLSVNSDELEEDFEDQHLCDIMDFGFAMIDAIDEFNNNLLEFNLHLRLGFNFGEVTAGVIGTTKLYYDIWGDAVNIASRMDSTGFHGRHVQVPEHCVPFLQKYFIVEFRDTLYVKGKDDMKVYLVKGRLPQKIQSKDE